MILVTVSANVLRPVIILFRRTKIESVYSVKKMLIMTRIEEFACVIRVLFWINYQIAFRKIDYVNKIKYF